MTTITWSIAQLDRNAADGGDDTRQACAPEHLRCHQITKASRSG